MHNLHVLIHQTRPFHQIRLHQAFNAQGLYNVRLSDDVGEIISDLARGRPADLLVLDHGMARQEALPLFARLASIASTRALLFVGQAQAGASLAHEARRHGLQVLVDVPWPRLAVALGRALDGLALERKGRWRNCHVDRACSLERA
ncbi:histidine kinase [Pseudomonas sp. RIT623]|uniref:histidine kinase n=1 Tax=Pseudomonas sp. RIT623 TaxID=2559075 RepID=UPI00106FE2BA|nr:histidine kinase [Pseudomonas sp. RIT623]TFF34176.1 histidine kinase [Pseudomonas sp. RIT623]